MNQDRIHTCRVRHSCSAYHGYQLWIGAVFLILLLLQRADALYLIAMDKSQTDHLKAYGIVFRSLQAGIKSYWLLNYRGGSFVIEESPTVELDARKNGVSISSLSKSQFAQILSQVESSNMEKVTLEKAPTIAVYTPPNKLPWDDAVTMALTYSQIPYEKIYDKEVLTDGLKRFDWLHLHHEDFSGQYSKFYSSFSQTLWYQRQKMELEKIAKQLGFSKVSECKKAVALTIKQYVEAGGFLFAMCTATNTLDIALASIGTDIVEEPFDGDGIDAGFKNKLDFSSCFAFENFTIETNALTPYFDNIDVNRVNTADRIPALDFQLFPFSAKLDPIPTMLTQNHTSSVHGFFGLCTSFHRSVIKKSVIVLGTVEGTDRVNYIHGIKGKGQFAFLGGHDPEDYAHLVGDTQTMLELHKNSPGYRLILNNVLFPAAEKKEKKT
ncbi:MAG: hypothetical protein JW795_04240 [Chitinivibrionales bacterium]|nr:hypothetical protein [Chitinivibrionales bacterium]